MGLIKLPFKILALPVILVLGVLYALGKVVQHLSSIVVGLIYTLIFFAAILVVINQAWSTLIGLVIVGVLVFLFQFCSILILEIVREVNVKLMRFIYL